MVQNTLHYLVVKCMHSYLSYSLYSKVCVCVCVTTAVTGACGLVAVPCYKSEHQIVLVSNLLSTYFNKKRFQDVKEPR